MSELSVYITVFILQALTTAILGTFYYRWLYKCSMTAYNNIYNKLELVEKNYNELYRQHIGILNEKLRSERLACCDICDQLILEDQQFGEVPGPAAEIIKMKIMERGI